MGGLTYISTHGYSSDAEEQTHKDAEDFTTMSLQESIREQVDDRGYETLDANELMTKKKKNSFKTSSLESLKKVKKLRLYSRPIPNVKTNLKFLIKIIRFSTLKLIHLLRRTPLQYCMS